MNDVPDGAGIAPEHAERIKELGKFQGERVAVRMAYERALEGFAHDDFGTSENVGYHARVLFDGSPHIVCFHETSDGFVIEIDNSTYEARFADWVESEENANEE